MRRLLAELADELEEVVRHRFAQRVVVDRAKGTTKVALASVTVWSRGLLRAPGMPRSLRLASLLNTQLLVPPRRGFFGARHTILNNRRNGFEPLLPLSYNSTGNRMAKGFTLQKPGQSRKPNGQCFVPEGLHILGAVKAR